jgi:hypothetical protein
MRKVKAAVVTWTSTRDHNNITFLRSDLTEVHAEEISHETSLGSYTMLEYGN